MGKGKRKGLDERQILFLRQKEVEASWPRQQWLSFFKPLVKIDEAGDFRRGKIIKWAAVTCGALWLTWALLFDQYHFGLESILGMGALALLALLYTTQTRWRKFFLRTDLHNNLRHSFVPFLEHLTLASESVPLKFHLTAKPTHYEDEALRQWKASGIDFGEFSFHEPWLSGTIPLNEGASLELEAADWVRISITTREEINGTVVTVGEPTLVTTLKRKLKVVGRFPAASFNLGSGSLPVQSEPGGYLVESTRVLHLEDEFDTQQPFPLCQMMEEVSQRMEPR